MASARTSIFYLLWLPVVLGAMETNENLFTKLKNRFPLLNKGERANTLPHNFQIALNQYNPMAILIILGGKNISKNNDPNSNRVFYLSQTYKTCTTIVNRQTGRDHLKASKIQHFYEMVELTVVCDSLFPQRLS